MVLAHSIEEDRTQDVQISENVTFNSMLLAPNTLQGLKNSGFYRPSPIQLHGIPLGKCGFDLILEAKSGTGKTAVFSIIALEKLDLNVGLQTVILAPTREIAAQICDVIKQLGSSYEGLVVEVVMGGIPVEEDINKFRDKRVHIIVGSPGRLRHLIQDKYIDVSTIRLFVLDEADKLMEKSFLPDINYIFSSSPKQKQVIMSSATYPETTKSFIQQYLQSGQHVCPDSNTILLGIKQKLTVVKYNSNIIKQTKNRFEELQKILSHIAFKQCLIFCNYQVRVAELHKMLTKHNWPAEQLYGQQEQLDRLDALKSLQEYKCRILVSTDLAARGIDASNVDLVINFEPPSEWQTFLHRIGRAGRFGSYGIAITMVSAGKEEQKFCELIKALKFPLNVSNLWNDEQAGSEVANPEPQNSETSCTKSLITNNREGTHKELWTLLSSDYKSSENEIESFSNLYDSFNNPPIESFSDLISSLQIHDTKPHETVMNNTYNLMPIQSILDDKYFKSINITKDDRNNDIVNKEKGKKTCELNNNVVDIGIPVVSHTTKSHDPKDYHDLLNKESNSDEECKKIPNANEALLRAGLPTAFGKCKKNCNNSFTEYNNAKQKFQVSSHDLGLQSTSVQNNKNKTLNENIENYVNHDNLRESNKLRKQITNISHHNENEAFGHYSKSDQYDTYHNQYLANKAESHCNVNNSRKANHHSINNEDEDFGYHSVSYQYRTFQKSQCTEKNVKSHVNKSRKSEEHRKKAREVLYHGAYYENEALGHNSTSDEYETYHNNAYNKDLEYSTLNIEYLNVSDVVNYTTWYKNLKNTVNQLQLAIYTDELSKI
ncbi:DEAD-box ATP-dependent RNA helicase CshE-like [Pectinophora gossypiella]|nr:DEAD-box ATP-dependent RNA helicase CshE-like [Pectinophora gossypiella]